MDVDKNLERSPTFNLASFSCCPDLLGNLSNWCEHVSFSFWIMSVCRPRLFVELGAHHKGSYAVFFEENLPSNLCEEEFNSERQGPKDLSYSVFSDQLKYSPKEPQTVIEDSSIDLVHIDCLLPYELVKRDFEFLIPKLSDRAVVLFHNTEASADHLGVDGLFQELSQQYPNFNFQHGKGLGVIVIGPAAHAAIHALCEITDQTKRQELSEGLSFLGNLWKEITNRRIEISEVAAMATEFARLHKEIEWKLSKAEGQLKLISESYSSTIIRYIPPSLTLAVSELSSTIGRITRSDRLSQLGIDLYNTQKIIDDSRDLSIQNKLDPGIDDYVGYDKWISLFDTIDDDDRYKIKSHIGKLDYQPLISVIMPVFNIDKEQLIEAIDSVRSQLYQNWELCIADDASTLPHVEEILNEYSNKDKRIKWVKRQINGNISEASNSALSLAAGEFIALMDHDDVLSENAFYEVFVEINKDKNVSIIYSDEDKVDENGHRFSPYFKSDWNKELFFCHNLISHLGIYRHSLVKSVGGFRPGYEGSQDYDLALRILAIIDEKTIRHIPRILYHWRHDSTKKSFSNDQLLRCVDAARRAKVDYFRSMGEDVQVAENRYIASWDRIIRKIPIPSPMVSIIIPTKNRVDLLSKCIDSILYKNDYPNVEIIIVDHESTDPITVKYLADLSNNSLVKIIPYAGEFNYSEMNNLAVKRCAGEIICLMNNDIEALDSSWLTEMVSVISRDDIGIVGAKLLYPSNEVQHAGVVTGIWGVAAHINKNIGSDTPGYFGSAILASEKTAVTAACMLIRKSIFIEVEGFDAENLAVAFNDVDLCLKVRQKGYKIIWTPFALLYHHESPSRGLDTEPEKIDRFNYEVYYMRRKWKGIIDNDPYYNPNLSLVSDQFDLAFPPRVKNSWQTVTKSPP